MKLINVIIYCGVFKQKLWIEIEFFRSKLIKALTIYCVIKRFEFRIVQNCRSFDVQLITLIQ